MKTDEACLLWNNAPEPLPYMEVTCLYPDLLPLYHPYELSDFPDLIWAYYTFAKNHPYLPYVTVTLYVFTIFYLQKLMEKRKAFDLRGPLIVWNLGLSVFSLIGFMRTVPMLYHNIFVQFENYEEYLCAMPQMSFGSGTTGAWVCLFIYSKVFELGDTLFIVLRKKPLIFLHYYHHITVLLFCFHSYSHENPAGLIFCCMNFCVHAIMYCYYGLTAARCRPKMWRPYTVTVAQLSQMIVGVISSLLSLSAYLSHLSSSKKCHVNRSNLIAGGLMYSSYLFLFAKFAVDNWGRLGFSKSTTVKSNGNGNGARRKKRE
ncbi:hypothetical protein TrVE_jg12739 [Triparma verrucosa]|uniref:Elongation of fatty acids protein n=1 Tax=Triparma verrucosa TaxID=1606542 RepID=A0A9W7BSE2_9STRA|nr:hypothetical protein TrVE_jg12739 [Triparma verrucosa]